MDLNQTIAVLEALASGCSPATGAMVPDESVLNERDVIRALQVAIERLKTKKNIPQNHSDVAIDEANIEAAIRLFVEHEMSPTYSRLTAFFLANRTFKNESIASHELYGKYKGLYQRGQLLDFFTTYLSANGYSKHGQQGNRKNRDKPWKAIDFFEKERFNNLSGAAAGQLKKKVNALGITKTDNLPEYLQKARLQYPRSHEPWTDTEDTLLWEALQETNNLNLLSDFFQRGPNAIEARGKRLLYKNQEQAVNDEQPGI